MRNCWSSVGGPPQGPKCSCRSDMVRSSERLTVTRTTVRQAWRLSTMAMYGRGGTTSVRT